MTLLATFKHISSKNADYGAAEAYLTFEHDEFTMKATLDENGRLIPREDYRISSLNCGGEDFAVACMRANLRYEKNQKREDVKSHHYIISFDPRDAADSGLTVDQAQGLGEKFCKEHFPGHQAIVCTHPDGHNHSGNIHVHIVINLLKSKTFAVKLMNSTWSLEVLFRETQVPFIMEPINKLFIVALISISSIYAQSSLEQQKATTVQTKRSLTFSIAPSTIEENFDL